MKYIALPIFRCRSFGYKWKLGGTNCSPVSKREARDGQFRNVDPSRKEEWAKQGGVRRGEKREDIGRGMENILPLAEFHLRGKWIILGCVISNARQFHATFTVNFSPTLFTGRNSSARIQRRCRWRMGRMNGTLLKFCLEIADLYMQGDEAIKRLISS